MHCPSCKLQFSKRAIFPIHCRCGAVLESETEVSGGEKHWICSHRGTTPKTIDKDLLACGCQTIRLYECEQFRELVTIQPIKRPNATDTAEQLRTAVSELFPEYTGRTCKNCRSVSKRLRQRIADVSVIVTCHNYGRYLRQCLDSIITQTAKPANIILVDDASDDDTALIAKAYEKHGVKYERVEYRNASQARNHGMSLAGKPAYFLFVDADNWLPDNYLAELLKGMVSQNTGVVYCRLWQVDADDNPIGWSPAVKPDATNELQHKNGIDTCSLIRRQALEQVNGWKDNRWGLQDWDLWLRIAAAGWQFRYTGETALNYRTHSGMMSVAMRTRYDCGMEVMRESQLTAIVTLFSGRDWNLDRWFDDLAALRWNKSNLHLMAVDNSRDEQFHARLNDKLLSCGMTYTLLRDDSRIVESIPAKVFTDTAKHRMDNAYAMNQHMGRLYSLATRYIPASAANVWSLEDDIGFPPETLEVLGEEMYRLQPSAVAGCLRNRFSDKRLLAWLGENQWVSKMPKQPIRVTGIGFYCLLARRAYWDKIAWRPGVTGADRHPYYDWAGCHDLQLFAPLYLVPLKCRHWQADGTALDC